jgi:phosphoribosylformylglycinamidine synthase subunit PurQ / glutaminase
MKFGVIIFPGSNCDHDMLYTLGEIMGQEVVELWHKDKDLKGVDAVMLPGGFSYGDYLRSGALARFSPIMEKVIEHANLGGFVFGVCNGFQILCESGLLPGTLTYNTSHKFICKNIHIRVETCKTKFTALTKKEQVLKIPIAHGEGRYYADDETIKQLRLNNQIIFRYCDDNGNITREANPNGSIENIAGICNEKRNVIGMMPHPERCSDDELGNTDGYILFKSLIES